MSDHLRATLAEMERTDIDVLLLGREANARWVTGAHRLWLAGTRPFAPGCVVVRATGAVHLLSITTDGLPESIPPERLYPISWNPLNIVGAVAAAPGVGSARRIGVDGMTPLFEQILGGVLPDAELVDGEAVLRDVRRVKSAADLSAIRAAVAAAQDAFGAVTAACVAGTRERDLKGIFEERMAGAGAVTTPAFEGTFCVADPNGPPRTLVTDRELHDGDLVHLRAGVLRNGWEAGLARTWPCGAAPPVETSTPARATLTAVVAACRPGSTVGALRAVSPGVSVDGVGMGHEELADGDLLEPGVALGVESIADGVLVGEMVVVTGDGAEVLTTFPDAPG